MTSISKKKVVQIDMLNLLVVKHHLSPICSSVMLIPEVPGETVPCVVFVDIVVLGGPTVGVELLGVVTGGELVPGGPIVRSNIGGVALMGVGETVPGGPLVWSNDATNPG
jgi:hypothetical protein